MDIGDQLAKMRTYLCDDQAGLTKLGGIEDNLDSLNYAPGAANMQNNVTLGSGTVCLPLPLGEGRGEGLVRQARNNFTGL